MAPRKGSRRFPFAKPGRASLWGAIGTVIAAAASASLSAALVVAVVAAVIGCYDPGN